MALKSKINKVDHAALSAELQTAYKVNPANAEEFLLDSDEADELRSAHARSKQEAADAKAALKVIEDAKAAEAKKLADANEELARKSGDIKSLDASWQTKLDAAKAEGKVLTDKLTNQIKALTIKNESVKMAAEISTVPELVQDLIEKRLTVDLSGDLPIVRVVDATGAASALSISELQQEFVANPKYAAIIKANSASGGGAGSQKPGGGATVKLSDMNQAQRTAMALADPTRFQALVDAQNAELAAKR